MVASAGAPLTETERKKLSKGVVAIRKEVSRRETERSRRISRDAAVAVPVLRKAAREPLWPHNASIAVRTGKTRRDESRVSLDHWNRESEKVRLTFALMAVGPWTEAPCRIRVWHVVYRGMTNAQNTIKTFCFRS